MILFMTVRGASSAYIPEKTIERQYSFASLKGSLNFDLNQTTEQSLVQGIVVANYFKRHNCFYFGGLTCAAISTEFGVVCPESFINAGADFNKFQVEYRVGNFSRNTVKTAGFDPQFSNFCILMGEGASAANAMELSFVAWIKKAPAVKRTPETISA